MLQGRKACVAFSLKSRLRFSGLQAAASAGVDRCLPRPALGGEFPRFENSVHGTVFVVMRKASEVRLTGLAAVRITWITAIVVCVLAVVMGLLSGTDGRNSSRQFPGFAFTDGGNAPQLLPDFVSLDPTAALVGAEVQKTAAKTRKNETTAPQGTRGQGVSERAPGDSHSSPGDSHSRAGAPPAGTQPEGAGGRQPSSTPGPNRPQKPTIDPPQLPQAPSVSVNVPKPPQAPSVTVNVPDSPQPPQAPSGTSGVSLPQVSVNVSAPIETPIVKVPDVSVQLP